MPTTRRFIRKVVQCSLYEAQDVLAEVDDVDLIDLEPGGGFAFMSGWQRRLLSRDAAWRLAVANPGLKRVRLTRDYDLFVTVAHGVRDLLHANAIDGWKDRCRVSVCWIAELHASCIARARSWLHALAKFDHVFLACREGVHALSEAIGRQVRWLPVAADGMRFAPLPVPPARVVDVYSIGSQWEGVHKTLRREMAGSRRFYIYDSAPSAQLEVFDHQRHRNALASFVKRSRYFLVAPGEADPSGEAFSPVPGRGCFEGAAAGAVMLGSTPAAGFRESFDWTDAVIAIRPDGSDVLQILADLDSQPGRLREISRRNTRQSLLRHDWVHRWTTVFEVAGIPLGSGAPARIERLTELADRVKE